jgi:hypothetical protein
MDIIGLHRNLEELQKTRKTPSHSCQTPWMRSHSCFVLRERIEKFTRLTGDDYTDNKKVDYFQ